MIPFCRKKNTGIPEPGSMYLLLSFHPNIGWSWKWCFFSPTFWLGWNIELSWVFPQHPTVFGVHFISDLHWLFRVVKKNLKKTGWWFQPIWKIWSSNWIISPSRGENKRSLKPPVRKPMVKSGNSSSSKVTGIGEQLCLHLQGLERHGLVRNHWAAQNGLIYNIHGFKHQKRW